jgi:hypothetical protein
MSSEFLNARSMAAPGIAGAVIMMVSNAMGTAFGLTGPTRGLVALGLSFVIGLLVLSDKTVPVLTRFALYVVNSLVIFSVSAGTNGIAGAATGAPPVVVVEATATPSPVPTAPTVASTPTPAPPVTRPSVAVAPAVAEALRAERGGGFFRPWMVAERAIVARPTPTPAP